MNKSDGQIIFENKWYECAKRLKDGAIQVWVYGNRETLINIGADNDLNNKKFYTLSPNRKASETKWYDWNVLKFAPPQTAKQQALIKIQELRDGCSITSDGCSITIGQLNHQLDLLKQITEAIKEKD